MAANPPTPRLPQPRLFSPAPPPLKLAKPVWDCSCGQTGMFYRAQFCSRCGHRRNNGPITVQTVNSPSDLYEPIRQYEQVRREAWKEKRRRTWALIFFVLFVMWFIGKFILR